MTQITVGDININYEIQGSGAPLLMIMGLSFSLRNWGKKFTDLLAQHYQPILFDNRDAGLTSQSIRPYSIADMADDAAGLLDELKIPKAHVFGVSIGGAIKRVRSSDRFKLVNLAIIKGRLLELPNDLINRKRKLNTLTLPIPCVKSKLNGKLLQAYCTNRKRFLILDDSQEWFKIPDFLKKSGISLCRSVPI